MDAFGVLVIIGISGVVHFRQQQQQQQQQQLLLLLLLLLLPLTSAAWCECVGMVNAATVLGPVVAFICGGFLLELYTHFDTVDTSTSVPALYIVTPPSRVH